MKKEKKNPSYGRSFAHMRAQADNSMTMPGVQRSVVFLAPSLKYHGAQNDKISPLFSCVGKVSFQSFRQYAFPTLQLDN